MKNTAETDNTDKREETDNTDKRDDTRDATSQRERSPSVAVDNLCLTYSDGTEAVQDVSLSIPNGEFFGFLGPNGAGKTTIIKIPATLLEPTGGTVEINGYDVTDQQTAVRESIGYMAQEISVDEELTPRENLRFACGAYGVPRGQRDDRIDELLALVDLADVSDTPAEQFSGGMKKRLDAATALVHDPDLCFSMNQRLGSIRKPGTVSGTTSNASTTRERRYS